ncbi:ATP-binding domain-containing protein [Janibacter limosus]|nr:ATP-binding domain-containing protein [Janibacter limosus]WKV16516.1 ATP-binding domain-containing protein [Janibacter limosus]
MRGKDAPAVTVRTIDSLASKVVRECTNDELEAMSFDDRIRAATDFLMKEEWEDVEDLDHLVVDEVQDVVGVRADFVLALLHSMRRDAGATFLGDPAQAIYDFQIAAEGGGTSSADLITAIRSDGARDVILKGQYRANSRDARKAIALRQPGADEATSDDVEDYWDEVIHVGSVGEAWAHLATRGGTTAFLTPTNGQALLVARELQASGVHVAVQRGAQDQSLAAWIGVVMCSLPGNSVSMEAFAEALASADTSVNSEAAWRTLRSLAGARGRELDKVALATRLRGRTSYPPELWNPRGDQVVVSTVHRAKGLEFDHVVLVEFASGRGVDEDEAVRARTRFVAVTRARDTILRVLGPADRDVFQPKVRPPAHPRWVRAGRQTWQTFGFELRAGDVDFETPSGASEGIHELLQNPSRIGSEVRPEPCPERSSLKLPIYRVVAPDGDLGVTGESFGVDLVGRIRTIEKQRRGWPSLRGVSVAEVATVVDETLRFRLVPVITGLAEIEWRNDYD